jgi:hypothetical protein
MLSFITFKDAPEQIEIVADERGLQELIDYLTFLKKSKDHMHLTIDNEINAFRSNNERKGKTLYSKSVRLEYCKTESWLNS